MPRTRDPFHDTDPIDAGSGRVIVIGMWIALVVAIPLAWVHGLQFPQKVNGRIFIVGLVFLTGGSLLRRHCWHMLGSSFTCDVRVPAGECIVTSGAYAFLRHPSYTGGILMYTGIGLALGNWASATLLVISSIAVYSYRISVEESALLITIGEPYRVFMRTRKRLIPYVY